MRIFREGRGPHALALAVVGPRLGNRLLDIGADAAPLFAQMAGKVGLTGHACAVVGSAGVAARVEAAAAAAGVLAEVQQATWPRLPVGDGAYDVAIIDNTEGGVAALDAATREGLAAEVLRALRPGGRTLVLDREPRGFLAAIGARRRSPWGTEAATRLLSDAGFKPVRLLAAREGQRFTEGWKQGAAPEGRAG
jgi:hypothetical protein